MNDLEKLKEWTVVVADTGDLTQVALHRPQDATTNPSLVLKAVQLPHSAELIKGVRARNAGITRSHALDQFSTVRELYRFEYQRRIGRCVLGTVERNLGQISRICNHHSPLF